MMKRAMISQPLAGKTEEEIAGTRAKAVKELESMGYAVIPTERGTNWYAPEEMEKRGVIHIPLCYLAKSLDQMCTVDAVYFCEGWAQARGCQIEHEAALKYGLEILNDGLTLTKPLRRREE